MLKSVYIEDIFISFVDLVNQDKIVISHQDVSAIYSFYSTINSGTALTRNQGNLILRILTRYADRSVIAGLDYTQQLNEPEWKLEFRIIDLSKKIWVESDADGLPWVIVKFPFQLKQDFEKEFADVKPNIWDSERKVRKVGLYNVNLIRLYEFVKQRNFVIDDTFELALGEVEEIWQYQDSIVPCSTIVDGGVELVNAIIDTKEWWKINKTCNIDTDLLLAKSIGHPLASVGSSTAEKIAASDTNTFWYKDIVEFLNFTNRIDGKICIILDRAGKSFDWLCDFDLALRKSNVDRSLVRVCFRASKADDPKLNEWIKTNGYGGIVDNAKILIFNHKPAKWLFKEAECVKILASNNLYSPANTLARDWFASHSCVMYIGGIRPTISKENKIVEL